MKAVDEEVGLGNGTPEDYKAQFAAKPVLWTRVRAKLQRRCPGRPAREDPTDRFL